jgi:putative nucleotidyltransferase with HDIG domain
MSRSGSTSSTASDRATAFERLVGVERAEAIRGASERWLVNSPERGWGLVVVAVTALVIGVTLAFMQRQVLVSPGQVMTQTRAVRVPVEVTDAEATQRNKQLARQRAARVYVQNEKTFASVRAALMEMPRGSAADATLNEVERAVLARVRTDTSLSAAWAGSVQTFEDLLQSTPAVRPEALVNERRMINREVELRRAGGAGPTTVGTDDGRGNTGSESDDALTARGGEVSRGVLVPSAMVVGVDTPEWERRAQRMVFDARFPTELSGVVTRTVLTLTKAAALYEFDESATNARGEQAAAKERPVTLTFSEGQVIYRRGTILSAEQHKLAELENTEYWASNRNPLARLHDLAAVGIGLVFSIGMALAIATFSPQVAAYPRRLAAVMGLLAGVLILGCVLALSEARLVALAIAAGPTLAAMTLAVAYDRRVALAMGSLLAILCCVAMDQGALSALPSLVGVVLGVRKLREVRKRTTLVFAGLWAGLATAGVGMAVGLLTRPLLWPAAAQSATESLAAGAAVIMCGFIILGLLPMIERLFGVTTGLTLIELRDPSHPLLRQLQQRAPGTYNHSLNVAALAEAAAAAVQADSLLAYVGSLYHDVGKMNKPEYFVENQTPGFNRHERLTPAMSLLVIVGHVKDGVELAREHKLPSSLLHFIEAHHGTTLVEYFFHRARKQAELSRAKANAAGGEGEAGLEIAPPQEIEYRYPGPKPRTREAAILMVCDAAESAARAMSDPSPIKIDSMVRAIAHKRLMDGQFDQSDLTLRDLTVVIDTVSRSLASIYHQRIQYPEGSTGNQGGGGGLAGGAVVPPAVAARA